MHNAPTSTVSLPVPVALVDAIAIRVAALLTAHLARHAAPPTASERPSPYMTVQEAAAYMRCRPQRIYDLLSQGRLSRHKDGSRVLILRADVEMLLTGATQSRTGAMRLRHAVA